MLCITFYMTYITSCIILHYTLHFILFGSCLVALYCSTFAWLPSRRPDTLPVGSCKQERKELRVAPRSHSPHGAGVVAAAFRSICFWKTETFWKKLKFEIWKWKIWNLKLFFLKNWLFRTKKKVLKLAPHSDPRGSGVKKTQWPPPTCPKI